MRLILDVPIRWREIVQENFILEYPAKDMAENSKSEKRVILSSN